MMKLFLSAAVLALAARSTQAYGGSGTTSDACAASTDCEGYCDTDNRCYSCSLCAALNDALEGTCPSGCGTGTGTGTGNTYSCCNNAAILAGTCGSYAGSCGGLQSETDCWGKILGIDICVAPSADDCCAMNAGGYVVIILGICCCLACCAGCYWQFVMKKK